MTVTIIGSTAPDIQRNAASKTRPNQAATQQPPAPAAATYPTDTIRAASTGLARPPVLDVPAAIAQTQAQNREAARATLDDADIEQLESRTSSQEKVQAQAVASVAAQTNNLPANILQLIIE